MSEPQISDPALPPLSSERISQIKNLYCKPKGFLYDNLSEAEISPNGLYEIIYSFIVKNYPNFPNTLNNNPDNQLQTFITAMNNIQQISLERLNLIDQTERTRTLTYISNFSGLGQISDALNNILFTYKENFGNISIWHGTDVRRDERGSFIGGLELRQNPFGPEIDTLNYFFPELNILFLDNRITLLIPCHDKFMKQNNETFLSSPASSLQDFILRSHINFFLDDDGFPDDDSDDDSDGDGDENLETTDTVTARAQSLASIEENNRRIQEARNRITELQSEITNIEGQHFPGPVTTATANRRRLIQLRTNQIARNRSTIRLLERLNQGLDQRMMLQNEVIYRRLQREAEDARLTDELKASEDTLADEERQAEESSSESSSDSSDDANPVRIIDYVGEEQRRQERLLAEQKTTEDATRLQAEQRRQERRQAAEARRARQAQDQAAVAAGTSESEEDGDNEEGVDIRSLFDENDDY